MLDNPRYLWYKMFVKNRLYIARGGLKVKTGCKDAIEYQGLSGRKVISQFNGGQITTDAGGLLLRELEQARGFMKEFSKCFTDYRDQDAIEHTVEELLSQRIYILKPFDITNYPL
ncbi:MAG: hypothetical protein D8M50_13045 [Candidatus Brocadia sp. AMX1]|nr:hypothetical protein [Candidatus Brocadia sp. AMX1]